METKSVPAIRFKGYTDTWKQRKWENVVNISTDMVNPKTGDFDNLPHIGPGNIESFSGRLLNNVHTVKEDALISGKFYFRKGDIIYGKINPQLGKYLYPSFEGLSSADCYVLNAENDLKQAFLYVILQTPKFYKYSISVSKRSGIPKINREELNEYKFHIPLEYEQQKIGNMFLTIEHLITLHQRKYEKLQNIKKSLLQKMFPAEGEDVPAVRFAGFTAPWKQRKLEDGMKNIGDGLHGTPKYSETGDYYFINGNNLVNGKVIVTTETKRVNSQELSKNYTLTNQTILLSINGTIGNLAYYNNENIFLGKSVAYLNIGEWDKSFVYAILQNKTVKNYIYHHLTGTTIKNLGLQTLKKIPILMPTLAEQVLIGKYFSDLDNLITLQQREIERLQKIKLAALQKMFV